MILWLVYLFYPTGILINRRVVVKLSALSQGIYIGAAQVLSQNVASKLVYSMYVR